MKRAIPFALAAALTVCCVETASLANADESSKADPSSVRAPSPSVEERLRQIEREALERQKAIADRILHVSAQRPILAVLDTDHRTGEAQTFVNNPFLAEGWTKQGKKHVFLEVSPEYNPLFEGLFARKISDEDFIATIKEEYFKINNFALLQQKFRSLRSGNPATEFAKGIIHLRNADIRVHGISQPLDRSAFTPKERDAIAAILEAKALGVDGMGLKDFVPHPEFATDEAVDFLKKKLVAVRLSADAATIDMAKKIAGNDHFVIIYGAEHFINPHDMNELLGSEKVVTLALYPFQEVKKMIDEKRGPSADPPDFVIMTGDTVLELTPEGRKAGFVEFTKAQKPPELKNQAHPPSAPSV